MSSTITVRDIDAGDKAWLKYEARRRGVSMEELVRRLIHERRERTQRHSSPSEAFRRYFGPEHGVDLPPRSRYRYRPVDFDENEA
jgi:hypothetical protein